MVLGFGPFFLSKKIHFLDKIEKKSKLGDFLEIRKISCIWSLLVMTFFSFVLKLMSYGRLILRRVKLTNFENVYHGPVVLWRLYLLSKPRCIDDSISKTENAAMRLTFLDQTGKDWRFPKM